jgi:hypothetical protein
VFTGLFVFDDPIDLSLLGDTLPQSGLLHLNLGHVCLAGLKLRESVSLDLLVLDGLTKLVHVSFLRLF